MMRPNWLTRSFSYIATKRTELLIHLSAHVLPFAHRPPSIHVQHLSSHKFRLLGQEENDRRVKVFRRADAAAVERLLAGDVVHDCGIAHRSAGERRGDERRREYVEA